MAFQVQKIHKLQDQLENQAYEWAYEDVLEYYGIKELEDLTEDQVEEIFAYSESDECSESYVGMALRSIVDNWEISRVPV